jgi:hypothetical protein
MVQTWINGESSGARMNSIQNQVFRNPDNARGVLSLMSNEALKSLAIDLKSQVNAGLMSDREAHEKINIISGIIMTREFAEKL